MNDNYENIGHFNDSENFYHVKNQYAQNSNRNNKIIFFKEKKKEK